MLILATKVKFFMFFCHKPSTGTYPKIIYQQGWILDENCKFWESANMLQKNFLPARILIWVFLESSEWVDFINGIGYLTFFKGSFEGPGTHCDEFLGLNGTTWSSYWHNKRKKLNFWSMYPFSGTPETPKSWHFGPNQGLQIKHPEVEIWTFFRLGHIDLT